jgi:hypothetical protein
VTIESNDFGPLHVSKITINMTLRSYAKTPQSHSFSLFLLHLSRVILSIGVFSYYSRKCYFRVTFGFHCILRNILSNKPLGT